MTQLTHNINPVVQRKKEPAKAKWGDWSLKKQPGKTQRETLRTIRNQQVIIQGAARYLDGCKRIGDSSITPVVVDATVKVKRDSNGKLYNMCSYRGKSVRLVLTRIKGVWVNEKEMM